jgi:beta-galactosidase
MVLCEVHGGVLYSLPLGPQEVELEGTAARRLGLSVDIVPPDADLAGYDLVLLPAQVFVDEGLERRLAESGATVLAGPRTGSKTRDFAIPAALPPD